MRRVGTIMLGAVGLTVLAVLWSCGDDAPAPPNEVRIRSQSFQPNDISIRPGEKVSWVNIIEFSDNETEWGTVGVSENIIEASWQALVDSISYKLIKDSEKK